MVYTHELTFVGPLLVKRYTSWARGEPRREWSVLQRVHGHVEDLTPRPVAADLDADPPTVTMTVLPGEPLDENPTPAQIDALAAAMATLWAVPHHNIPSVDVWRDDLDFARRLTTARRPARGVAAAAYDAAASWWHGPDPALLHTEPTMTVLGHRDPNLANTCGTGRRFASSTSRTRPSRIQRPSWRSWWNTCQPVNWTPTGSVPASTST